MIEATIKHSDGERELHLSAKNMNHLLWKIQDWQNWRAFEETASIYPEYKKDPEGFMKQERESGWYCDE